MLVNEEEPPSYWGHGWPGAVNALVVQFFFANYRASLWRELAGSERVNYSFAGDDREHDGIPALPVPAGRFIPARRFVQVGPFLWHCGVPRLGLRRTVDCLVLQGNPYFLSSWCAALLARMAGKRVVFWTHGWHTVEAGVKGLIRRCFYRLAHALLLYGHHAKSIGLRLGFDQHRMHVVYNSLDYPLQRSIRESVSLSELEAIRARHFDEPENPLVICTARLTRACRFDLLLEAQRRLRAAGVPINVLLVGAGPEEALLKAQARRHRLPVCFYGPCHDEATVARLYMASDLTASPGKVGLTALHSLSYGTPVITHGSPEEQMPEWEIIIPGATGDFFRRDDVDDLCRVIKEWVNRPRPPLNRCVELIERFYNPEFQRRVFDRAVCGLPADDLFWLREPAGPDAAARGLGHATSSNRISA